MTCNKCNKSKQECTCGPEKTKKFRRKKLIPKFTIGDVIFYMFRNQVCASEVIGVETIQLSQELSHQKIIREKEWYSQGIIYLTEDGLFPQYKVFDSKSALLKSL